MSLADKQKNGSRLKEFANITCRGIIAGCNGRFPLNPPAYNTDLTMFYGIIWLFRFGAF
jgi:hypothetical protein